MHFKSSGSDGATAIIQVVEKEVAPQDHNFVAISGLSSQSPGIIPGSILSLDTVTNKLVTIEFMGGTLTGAGTVSVIRSPATVVGANFINGAQSPSSALRFFDIQPLAGSATYMIRLGADISFKDVTMLVRQS